MCLKGIILVNRKAGNCEGFFAHETVLGNSILLCHMRTPQCLVEKQELNKGNGKIMHLIRVA